jgi:hypothetical protein
MRVTLPNRLTAIIAAIVAIDAVLWPVLGEGAEIVRGPYLQSLLDTSVKVIYETDVPAATRIECRPAKGEPIVREDPGPAEDHRFLLDGLQPGTIHRYGIYDGEVALCEEFSFRTSPGPGGTIRAAVVGDSGSADEDQLAVARLIAGMEADLFLHTGDLIYILGPDETIFRPYREILARSCFYPCRGNHWDWHLDWKDLFDLPYAHPEAIGTYYSFDWGSAHFVSLDTEDDFRPESRQMGWLVEDLEAARGKGLPWTILIFHKVAYSVGVYYYLKEPRAAFAPIADRFGVDLVLNGHDHNYQRSHPVRDGIVRGAWQSPDFVSPGGTIYVVTAGGGAVLYGESIQASRRTNAVFLSVHHALQLEISPDVLSAEAIGMDGEVIDRFSIRKPAGGNPLRMLRGDANLSGQVGLSDAILILDHLFMGTRLECPATARVTDDGDPPDITDGIFILFHLFLGKPSPPPPYPECGPAPEADDAWCYRTSCP